MEKLTAKSIDTLYEQQKVFFASNETQAIPFRVKQLKKLTLKET